MPSASVLDLRKLAQYKSLPNAGPSSGIGVNCARCEHCGDFSDEGMRGFCGRLGHMVSTWHNCNCAIFEVRTTPKASDVLKAQLERQEAERAKK
jgi:hypothetical protein